MLSLCKCVRSTARCEKCAPEYFKLVQNININFVKKISLMADEKNHVWLKKIKNDFEIKNYFIILILTFFVLFVDLMNT